MTNPRPPNPAAEMWRAVESALTSWSRTARLCLIYLAKGSPALAGALAWLVRH